MSEITNEIQIEETSGFSWMSLFFAPYYYAGYGKLNKGLIFAIIGFIPLTALIVNIYAGIKAKKELPIGKQDFKWGAAIGVFLIQVVLTGGILVAFDSDLQQEMNASTDASYYSHDDFRTLVAYKTEQEVLEILGSPSDNQDMGGMKMWYYEGITYDSVTQNIDNMTQIRFSNGSVAQVNFM